MNPEKLDALAAQAGFDIGRLRTPLPGGFPREDVLALESFAAVILAEVNTVMQILRCDDGSDWDQALNCVQRLLERQFETIIGDLP